MSEIDSKNPKCSTPDAATIFLKLPTENIVLLKFLLESYEGFAELRTLHRERGEVVLLAAPDLESELLAFLDSTADMVGHRRIEPPETVTEDWLFASVKEEQSA